MQTTTVSLRNLTAAHQIASVIAGALPAVVLHDPDTDASATINAGRDYTEIRWSGALHAATITIQRPARFPWDEGRPTRTIVTHSSSSSSTVGVEEAALTARALTLAVEVARQLDAWLDAEQLDYLEPRS